MLPWEVVHPERRGEQYLFRLRCGQDVLQGMEIDLFHPFEAIHRITTRFDPRRVERLREWLLDHDTFLLGQALGPSAVLTVQPGRLDIGPCQLVQVMGAEWMSRRGCCSRMASSWARPSRRAWSWPS